MKLEDLHSSTFLVSLKEGLDVSIYTKIEYNVSQIRETLLEKASFIYV